MFGSTYVRAYIFNDIASKVRNRMAGGIPDDSIQLN